MGYKFIVFSTVCLLSFGCCKDMFTSIVELTKALEVEHNVAHELKQYIKREISRIQALEIVADDLEQHSSQALLDPLTHLANPVNAYLIVKRFAIDWNNIVKRFISPQYIEDFLANLSVHTNYFPDGDDLYGSVLALLRLQDVYNLPTGEIASGNIKGVKKSPDMTADDCFQLGLVSYNREDYYHAFLWFSEALKVDSQEIFKTSDRRQILDYFSFATFRQGNVHHALNLTAEWLSIEPDHDRAQTNLLHYQRMIIEQNLIPEMRNIRVRQEYKESEDYINYEKLCRGEKIKKYAQERLLNCQYRRHVAIFYLRPLKEETIYLDPRIILYHDVLTNMETNIIKRIATPMLERSGVFQLRAEDNPFTEYRTSKTAWISDSRSPLIESITLKSKSLSNLTLDTVEFLQVLNYGIAGQYEPHYDFARPNEVGTFEEWRGNRVATVIYYLNDVEAGGATIFSDIGVSSFPEKGACLIWYNLLLNGNGDYRTRHAGCPVLSGTKWVSNKWFHINGQEFSRPCSINPEV